MKQLLQEVSYAAIDTRSQTVIRDDVDTDVLDMTLVNLSGIIIDGERHWSLKPSDQIPVPCTVSDIADSSGEWAALAVKSDGDTSSYLFFGDHAGYAPTFYALLPGTAVVVSDSFSGVVEGLTALGGTTSLNVENYLTLVTGRTATFDTLISSQTMANEISVLGANEALLVDNTKAVIFDRSRLSRASAITNYEDALLAAVNVSSKTIRRFVSANSDMLPLITLTGGVDSRLVFALLRTTSLHRKFQIWTMDPRNSRNPNQKRIYTADVEISNQIRKAYKLNWMPPRRREKFAISFEESVARHQSFHSNFSFKFFPSNHLALEVDPILTLRGGGGELLRGTAGARLAGERYKVYRQEGGRLEKESWAAEDYLQRSFLTEELRPEAQRFIVNQLGNYRSPVLRTKLDSFYQETRNRGHFGHYRVSASSNDHILQALSNPYLQRLVSLADNDYKSTSGIVRDIFNATEPKLRKFPFEDDAAHEELYTPSRRPFKYKDRDSWISDFDKNKELALPYHFQPLGEPGVRGENSNRQVRAEALTFINRGFRVVEEIAPVELQNKLRIQHEKLLGHIEANQLPIGKIIAKVASAIDLVTPMPLDSARHFFTDHKFTSGIPPRNIFHKASANYRELIGE